MPEPTWPQPGDHYGDHQPEPVYEPPRYSSALTGPGRWCWLVMNGKRAGVLATDDNAALAFLPVDAAANISAPAVAAMVQAGLLGAAAAGSAVTEVFDAYASRVSLGLSAEPVQVGSLDDLLTSLYH